MQRADGLLIVGIRRRRKKKKKLRWGIISWHLQPIRRMT